MFNNRSRDVYVQRYYEHEMAQACQDLLDRGFEQIGEIQVVEKSVKQFNHRPQGERKATSGSSAQ